MNTKVLWSIIFCLLIINCMTVGYFINKERDVSGLGNTSEVIATIGEDDITREQWMAELESRFGKDTLKELINGKVVNLLADKHKITVSDDVIERELTVYKSMYNSLDEEQFGNEENWEEQIRYSILLEELLTKDVTVPEEDIKSFYNRNKDQYNIEEAYRLAQIIVKTETEAKMLIEELEGGSSFEALALEKSLDEFTANSGGDIGFVSKGNEYIPAEYFEVVSTLNEKQWSKPIKVDSGYAVVLLQEKLKGISYSYEDVKGQIRRQIALEQMEGSVSVEPLWDEVGVTWFYGDEQVKK